LRKKAVKGQTAVRRRRNGRKERKAKLRVNKESRGREGGKQTPPRSRPRPRLSCHQRLPLPPRRLEVRFSPCFDSIGIEYEEYLVLRKLTF